MYLLDTNVFLWLWLRPERIPATLRSELEDRDVRIFVSAISAFEIAIKHDLGMLRLPGAPAVFVRRRMRAGRLSELPLTTEHALAAGHLPPHSLDPFDRLLVAQAQCEGLSIISGDPTLAKYDVRIVTV